MDWNKEEMALRIMRILYQYRETNEDSGLTLDDFLSRFDSIDIKKVKRDLQFCLNDLLDQSLIYKHKEEYCISEKGKEHYENFKFLKKDSAQGALGGAFQVRDWNGNYNFSPYSHSPHNYNRSESHFPGHTKEFIPHFKEMHELIKEVLNELMDLPVGEKTFDKLEQLKAIMELNSDEG